MSPETKQPRNGGDWVRVVRELAPYLGAGTTLAVTVFLGVAGGHWADRRWGTEPLFTLVGAAFGLFAGFYHFLQTVRVDKK